MTTCLSLTFSSCALARLWPSTGALYRWTDLLADGLLKHFPLLTEDQYICDSIDLIMVLFL